MIAFANRNLKLYFRDKTGVFFSMLSVVIIIGLYVLFLGDVWTDSIGNVPHGKELMDNWVMAGVLAVTSVTTTMGMLGNMVQDKGLKIVKDFYVSPMKRYEIAGGYILSAFFVGIIMSFFAFLLAEVYIVANGGAFLQTEDFLKVVAAVFLATFMNTTMMFLLISFFRTINSFSTASTVVGVFIGFLTGIYLPIGMFPEGVQWVIKLFPTSQAAALFRQIMMKSVMAESFAGAPKSAAAEVQEYLGVVYHYGDYQMSQSGSVLILLTAAAIFLILGFIKASKKKSE